MGLCCHRAHGSVQAMTLLREVFGALAGLAALGSLTLGTHALRRRFLSTLHGPPALLTDMVGVLSITIVASQLLGVVGLYHFYAVAPALVLCGLVAWWLGTRAPLHDAASPQAETEVAADNRASPSGNWAPRGGPIVNGTAIVAVGILAADWIPRLVHVYRTGPTFTDTMWYHLPIAARFAQTGSLLPVPIVSGGDALPSFYPHTSELLHATGILFLTHDTLTPLLNLFWLVIALFAAWCIGRPFGVAPLALTAVACVLGGPQLVLYEAGQGLNDLLGVAMTLVAIALLVNTWSRPLRLPGAFVAGLAMGIAMGSKFTVVGPAVALTLCVVVFCAADLRVRLGLLWLAGLTLTGAFWYLRNLIAVGNPVPPADVSIGPIDLPHLHYPGISSVSSHLFNGDWSKYLAPGFRYALGPVWWAVLGIMIAGFVAGIVLRVDDRIRLIAIIGLAGALFFVFTPQLLGLSRDASYFLFNVRYLAIPMVLGAVALAAASARYTTRVMSAMAIVFGAVLLASQFDGKLWRFKGGAPPELGLPTLSRREFALGIVCGIVTVMVVLALVVVRSRRPAHVVDRSWAPRIAGAALVLLVGGLLALQHFYVDHRYRDAPYLANTFEWARNTRDERIGVVGTVLQYPLTGSDSSNHVEILELRTSDLAATPIRDCETWRETVNRERLDYVLVTTGGYPVGQTSTARAQRWTATDPAARLVLTDRDGKARAWLYQLQGRLDPSACPRAS
jgi:hypothetical protein